MPPPDDDTVLREKRRRHAEAVARWRSRERRKVQLFEFEAGAYEYDLAVRYAGLREDQTTNKTLVSAAMGRLLRKALLALVSQEEARRQKVTVSRDLVEAVLCCSYGETTSDLVTNPQR
jgi:hypothetical protein